MRKILYICCMQLKEEILYYLRENIDLFKSKYCIVKMGLFGSVACGDFTEESDIDILLEWEPGVTNLWQKKIELRRIIKEKFNRDVDLCTIKYIKPYYKANILKSVVYV